MSQLYPMLTLLLLGFAAVSDCTTRIIRNWISLAILLLFVLYAVSPGINLDVIAHILLAGGLFLLLFAGFAFNKVGGGDVKLATVTMLWAGPAAAGDFLMVTALVGGLLALIVIIPQARLMQQWMLAPVLRLIDRAEPFPTHTVPYGIAIAAGGCVALYGRYVSGN
ncbi:MAG: peptidase [Sneathiella sp.]|uniref:A24 family peptidase n=1 Tax=Sneathiella sp. TaxID=1964365 RepID=UPI000C61BE87|nr:prepilin peptidase [Sneathiella sp.]MAL78308.1 peptidase [Sneathiella sp.]|tara:strand:- start:74 stop:571 length:498 start_codon:yes stop_codon:yes gene_type:complete